MQCNLDRRYDELFPVCGWQAVFHCAAGRVYFADPSLARRGDINLNVAHHVNVTVDNGEKNTGNEIPDNPDTNAGGSRYMFSVGNVKSGKKGNDVKLLPTAVKIERLQGIRREESDNRRGLRCKYGIRNQSISEEEGIERRWHCRSGNLEDHPAALILRPRKIRKIRIR